MSNQSVINQDQVSDLRITSVFTRLNAKSEPSLGMVVAQRIPRPNRTQVGNPLLNLALGGGNTTKLTAVQTITAQAWPSIKDKLVAAGVDVPETPEATKSTTKFVECDLSMSEVFGVEAEIQLTESPFPSPFNPNQQPQVNPASGQVIVPLNADGDPITAAEDDQPFDRYYRHTEVVAKGSAQHQFIRDYVDGVSRELPQEVMARYAAQNVTEVPADAVLGA